MEIILGVGDFWWREIFLGVDLAPTENQLDLNILYGDRL